MPDLTIQQRFGRNATLDLEYKQLIINLDDLADLDPNTQLGDFTNGLGLDTSAITETNKGEYASAILWALVGLSQQNQPATNNDETVATYITNGGKSGANRNSTPQFAYRAIITSYINDNTSNVLDPDELVNSSGETF